MNSYSIVDVRRDYRAEFFEPVWIRSWHRRAGDMAQFRSALREVRSCSGFGVDDPYQIRVSRDTVTTLTAGNGETLQEHLRTPEFHRDEELVRKLGEQLCLAILRLHDGVGERHGALCPFNVRVSEEGDYSVWSVPTARYEGIPDTPRPTAPPRDRTWLRQAGRMAKQQPTGKAADTESRPQLPRQHKYDREEDYRAPEEPNGSFLSDVYSVGAILYRVLSGEFALPRLQPSPSKLERLAFGDISHDLSDIVYKSLQVDPLDRHLGIKKLALALNPRSRIAELDIAGARVLVREGLQYFSESRIERASECFSEAARRDPLSVAVWNNVAAVKIRKGQWLDAVYELERAYKLSATHPVICSNIAHCFLHLKDSLAVNHWSELALTINPWLVRPAICLAELALRENQPYAAAGYARQAVVRAPHSRIARLCLAKTHDAQKQHQRAEEDRQHAYALDEEPLLWDTLIDEDNNPPWGPLREENSGPGNSDWDGDETSGVPRTPYSPRPSRSATRPFEDRPPT